MEHTFIIVNGMRRPSADVEIASSLVDPAKRSASGELALDNFTNLVSRDGYAFIAGSQMCALLEEVGLQDWDTFKDSWNNLESDSYMADGGSYRRRRYAAFTVSADNIVRKPHQPHYQSRDYNHLNGGIQRWFAPILEDIGTHPALRAILRTCYTVFSKTTSPEDRPTKWQTEVHQFRIEASPSRAGEPTPEGIHRDGVDWVLVLLVSRENIAQGTTTIYDGEKRLLGSFTLAIPLDAALVDDHRVFHGVTPVVPEDPEQSAYRDVLVVTLRRENDQDDLPGK